MSDSAILEPTGSASGGVRTLLRLEGLALFLGMTLLYGVWDGSWWVYAILFLAPDLSFAGYLAGPRAGAVIYNAAHSYMAPMTLMTLGFGKLNGSCAAQSLMAHSPGMRAARSSAKVAGRLLRTI